MGKLPDNMELRKLYHLGLRDTQVAADYGVSRQAVQKRWRQMGLVRRPISQEVRELLRSTWDLRSEKETALPPRAQWASRCLRLVLRRRLGDTLTPNEYQNAETWLGTLRERDWVVSYDREVGWHYATRVPEDNGLLVRWPTDRPLPESKYVKALTMPAEGSEITPISQ